MTMMIDDPWLRTLKGTSEKGPLKLLRDVGHCRPGFIYSICVLRMCYEEYCLYCTLVVRNYMGLAIVL